MKWPKWQAGWLLIGMILAGCSSQADSSPEGFWIQTDDPSKDNVIVHMTPDGSEGYGFLVVIRHKGGTTRVALDWALADGKWRGRDVNFPETIIVAVSISGGRLDGKFASPYVHHPGPLQLAGLRKADSAALQRLADGYVPTAHVSPEWIRYKILDYLPAKHVEAAKEKWRAERSRDPDQ